MAITRVQFTTGDEVTCSEEHSILDVYEFKKTYVLLQREGYAIGNQVLLRDQAHTITAHLTDTTPWWSCFPGASGDGNLCLPVFSIIRRTQVNLSNVRKPKTAEADAIFK